MKKLGIVGGIGPESTIAYYRLIFEIYAQQAANGTAPSLVIESVEVRKLLAWMESGNLAAVTNYLSSAIEKLAAAGADFALLSANTPHIVFDELARTSRLPLLSIVEATRDYASARGLRKVALLGTRFTMQARFFPDVFARSQITIAVPSTEEQQYLHGKYINELLNGIFLPETRSGIVSLIGKMKERDQIEGVILGGTELPLLLQDKEVLGLPLLDTTEIHVRAAVQRMLE
jgi:aspartate racemase